MEAFGVALDRLATAGSISGGCEAAGFLVFKGVSAPLAAGRFIDFLGAMVTLPEAWPPAPALPNPRSCRARLRACKHGNPANPANT
eukprot:527229-Alexandrium_andersonii.AAC.1